MGKSFFIYDCFVTLIFYIVMTLTLNFVGPVAQWITRLTTDQEIPGSSPGRFVLLRMRQIE